MAVPMVLAGFKLEPVYLPMAKQFVAKAKPIMKGAIGCNTAMDSKHYEVLNKLQDKSQNIRKFKGDSDS